VEVVILPDEAAVGSLVADAVCRLLAAKPDGVLGLATGSSPVPTYRELVRRRHAGAVSFARARGFLLDEYVGLPPGHPQAYRTVIQAELASHVDFAAGAVQGPDGTAKDLPGACRAYEQAIAAAGGVDLQLLGIGSDGHLAFNEPGSSLSSRTRVKTLTALTRSDNARFFDSPDDVPRHVLTQGLGTIREARHLVLCAVGDRKAEAVAATVEGPVSASCPASVLQLHPHVTVVLDEAAAALLRLAGYFREAWAGKPPWQSI
jgi:glucosamine-6-phosphate deaminase